MASVATSPEIQQVSWLRRSVEWTVFPVVYLVTHGAAIVAMDAGYSPASAVLAMTIGAAVLLFWLEVFQPHSDYWNEPQKDVATDIAHLLFSSMLIPPLFTAIFRSGLLLLAAWLAQGVGSPVWPHSWPLLAQLALALAVAEFGQYWWHRCAHEKEFLWRFHATHHSPRRLYWLNSCRFHPVDSLAQYTLEVTPLILLGSGPEVLALFTLSTAVIGMFQHANIRLSLGPLNWIFSMTELHRWHHSRKVREGNSNYGANLILWDIVFKTRYLPKDRELPAHNVGLAGMPNFPTDYAGQLASPFRWRQLKRGNN